MQSRSSSGSTRSTALSLEAEFDRLVRRQRKVERVRGWLKESAIALINFLTGQQSLSIRAKQLRNGEIQWTVYDPTTDGRYVFDSQQAVRTWLEQRYYR